MHSTTLVGGIDDWSAQGCGTNNAVSHWWETEGCGKLTALVIYLLEEEYVHSIYKWAESVVSKGDSLICLALRDAYTFVIDLIVSLMTLQLISKMISPL